MKNEISIILLSALVLVSCVKDLNSVEPELEVLMPEKQVTLTAIGEDGSSTKTVRDETDGSVWWTPGDAISVFSPSNNKFVCNAAVNSRIASFSGAITRASIGEIIHSSGMGVVAWISADGATALLMSVSELQCKDWTTSNNWCCSYGEGWRMPTIDELTLIHKSFSEINASLNSPGYTQLSTGNRCYWSSTVNPANSSYYYRERLHDGEIFKNLGNDEKVSSTANYVRAVKSVLLPEPTEDTRTCLYPYDVSAFSDGTSVTMTVKDIQTATPGTFASGYFPALGKSEGSYIKFYNICGGIRFSVTKEGIHTIKLEGNNGEIIAGKIKVGFSSDGVPEVKEVLEGSKAICLKAPDDGFFEIGKYYYFVVLPTLFTKGFSLTFDTLTSTGKYYRTVQTAVKRSVFSGLSNIDGSVVTVDKVVDLGLSVKWASYNLGAESPEGYGDYFAWGETEPYYEDGYALVGFGAIWKPEKDGYDWNSYQFTSDGGKSFNKYNLYGGILSFSDADTPYEDDAARALWGSNWRTPTVAEWLELLNNCTWTWTTVNGVQGYWVTSKKPGFTDKSIFLPASGYRIDRDLKTLNSLGRYWHSSVNGYKRENAFGLSFSSTNIEVGDYERRTGFSIRPVYSQASDQPSAPFLSEKLEEIDLGLDVIWASCDVGSTKPQQKGDVFAWGETRPNQEYHAWSSYLWCYGSYDTIYKYNMDDQKKTLDIEDDAARVNMGGTWRTPRIDEISDLYNNTTLICPVIDGAECRIYVSKKNGVSLFIPDGNHWSSEMGKPYSSMPSLYAAMFSPEGGLGNKVKCLPSSIRAVKSKVDVSSVSFSSSNIDLWVGQVHTLGAIVSPSNSTPKTVYWSSDNEDVAKVDQNGTVTALSRGLAVITATAYNGIKGSCTITVKHRDYPLAEAVDLGLSVKWASFNLGASLPEEYGDYFAWLKTEPYYEPGYSQDSSPLWIPGKESGYSDDSYGSSYNYSQNVDAAYINWGGSWRLPTISEWSELQNNCSWTLTKQNGINGYLVTGKQDGFQNKSIFLPFAGYRTLKTISERGSQGLYWSSTRSNSEKANILYIRGNSVQRLARQCSFGLSIRPVCP